MLLQVLNLLLFKLTKRQYDETLLEFLFIDEHLVDIGDDLVDYEVQHTCYLHSPFFCLQCVCYYACRMMSLQTHSIYTEVTTSSCEHYDNEPGVVCSFDALKCLQPTYIYTAEKLSFVW